MNRKFVSLSNLRASMCYLLKLFVFNVMNAECPVFCKERPDWFDDICSKNRTDESISLPENLLD